MDKQKFQNYYSQLNSKQKEAVDFIDGPVMVVAGPGTGKTQVLTLRIANILLKIDTTPDNILALTFTESGVNVMRKRLTEIIGSAGYYVNIFTFHSFCNDIIQSYPDEFDRFLGDKNITEIDQVELLEKLIKNLPLKLLKPFGETFLYLRDIQKALSDLKREAISPQEFNSLVERSFEQFNQIENLYHEKGFHKGKIKGKYSEQLKILEKNKELAVVYGTYQKELEKQKMYDYDDMILYVVEQLRKNEDLLLRLQERFQYILIDEHQDTNNAQNKVIELLGSFYEDKPNIFVVGDDKQAIFRFQGSSLENFMYFQKKYPKSKLIFLDINYRSTQGILDASHSLIENNLFKLSNIIKDFVFELKANIGGGEKILVYEFSSQLVQYYFIAQKVKELLANGANIGEIAVLYRENRDVFPLAEMLSKFAIPFAIYSSKSVLEDQDIRKIIFIIEYLVDFESDEKLTKVLHIDFLDIPSLDMFKLIRYLTGKKTSLLEVMASPKLLDEIGLESKDQILKFYNLLSSWRKNIFSLNPVELLEKIISESGFMEYLLSKPESMASLDKVDSLMDELKKVISAHHEYSLIDFAKYLELLNEHNVLIKERKTNIPDVLKLMTAHGSKGLEFDYVFILDAHDKHWGHKRQINRLKLIELVFVADQKTDQNEDERRLFYVALTRARKNVFISYSTLSDDGREQNGSQFIGEIKEELKTREDSAKYEDDFKTERGMLYLSRKADGIADSEHGYLRELFLETGLSATALNNYLECPWQYFYRNLIRIPSAKSKFAIYGSAVHFALRRLFDKLKVGELLSREKLIQEFERGLNFESVSRHDLDELLKKGRETLFSYYDFYKGKWNTNTLNEFKIKGVLLDDKIKLNGQIDKIEIKDGSNYVNVVDYKTGRSRSRGEIEGKTQNSNGDYKRQLVFYKLLLDNYPGVGFKMETGEIDFVEPDKNCKFRKEKFEIDDSDVKNLESIVRTVSAEISNLSFWDKRCDRKDCQYCTMRELSHT